MTTRIQPTSRHTTSKTTIAGSNGQAVIVGVIFLSVSATVR